ncbi:MAG: hypothetical protein H0X36_12375, partial [Sphingomonadaceae bacterium]|nr:hypothetical protein [Sphingomonadaceae bacterium]
SSLMSSHRGNGQFDPRPIPDLGQAGKISRDPQARALETFIRGLIVEEFDGPAPPSTILDDLALYLRSLGNGTCPAGATEPIRLAGALNDARRAAAAAGESWRRGDGPAARLLLSATRSALGRIDERFAPRDLAADRQAIRNADFELLAIEQAMDRRDRTVALRIAAWRAGVPRWASLLHRDEGRSLYDVETLSRALAAGNS